MFVILVMMMVVTAGISYSKVDITKHIKKYYPEAEVEVRNIILSKDKLERAKKIARVNIRTRLISFYIIRDSRGNILGYAFVDTHRVRTKPETVLYIISPEGKIEIIEVLAFLEPPEYKADERWLKLFVGKTIRKDKLALKKDIPNVTGATLTSRAITKSVRKVLALWEVIFGDKR